MSPLGTPLQARSEMVLSVLLIVLAVMGLSPFLDLVAMRWPLQFSAAPWRYQTFLLLLSTGPQLVILPAVIAALAVVGSHRMALRGASIALCVVATIYIVVDLFFLLDFLQVRRLVAQTRKAEFDAVALKAVAFTGLVVLGALWAGVRGWQASGKLHRAKRDSLVVGQDKSAESE